MLSEEKSREIVELRMDVVPAELPRMGDLRGVFCLKGEDIGVT